MATDELNRRFWQRRARREAARFNLAWWLQHYLPWIFGLGLSVAAILLALRTARQPADWLIPAAALALVAGAIAAYVRSRHRYITASDTLTRLDADLRLHNRLTVAEEGITPWPAPQDNARLALNWRWNRLIWPPVAAIALALIALYIPIPEPTVAAAETPPPQPAAWTAMEEKLDVLEKTELVEEKAREEFREAVESLRERPQEDWYSHESLEATDHLNAQLNENLAALEKSLSASLGAMDASRQLEQSQFNVLQKSLDEALLNAAAAMEAGALPLDPKLLSQLKEMKGAKLRQMSAEEWKEMQGRMKEAVLTASGGQKDGKDAMAAALAAIGAGEGLGQGPGAGGTSRGPGSAPLTLSDKESRVGSDKTEVITNDDLSHATVGDPAGISQGRHEVDQAEAAPVSGGAMSSMGQGGQAAWQQTATPAEQAALQRFFK